MPSGVGQEYKEGVVEADFVFKEIILPAVKTAIEYSEEDIIREVDNFSTGSIGKSIIRNIAYSEYTIADVTGLNPNVMFELGIRYSLQPRKTIILVQENSKRVPFDIKDYRYIEYHPFKLEDAKKSLISFLTKSKDNKDNIDSPVYDSIKNLNVNYPTERDNNVMSWNLFQEKITKYTKVLEDSLNNEEYKKNIFPDAIIGLSNGGMLVSDLITIKFPQVPVYSVWNKRIDDDNNKKKGDYFKNNHSLHQINSFIKTFKDENLKNILIVDDEVLDGNTFRELFKIIKDEINGINVLFLPLFTRSTKLNLDSLEGLLINNETFKHIYNTIFKGDTTNSTIMFTDCSALPYKKFKVESHK